MGQHILFSSKWRHIIILHWLFASFHFGSVTTCARCSKYCISTYNRCSRLCCSTYASCDDLCHVRGLFYFYPCQQWLPVPGMQSGIFLPMTAYARLWQPVPGMWIVIFLLMPAVPGSEDLCQVCKVLYFYLCQLCQVHQVLFFYLCQPVPGCDDLCQVCGLLHFYLCQLWRPVPSAGYAKWYISTYARLWRWYLCQVCGLL